MIIKCRGCTGEYIETTDKYDPDICANGAMFRLRKEYRDYGWSLFPEDEAQIMGDLTCPHCGAFYCDGNGKVLVIDNREKSLLDGSGASTLLSCAKCGRECKTPSGKANHEKACNG